MDREGNDDKNQLNSVQVSPRTKPAFWNVKDVVSSGHVLLRPRSNSKPKSHGPQVRLFLWVMLLGIGLAALSLILSGMGGAHELQAAFEEACRHFSTELQLRLFNDLQRIVIYAGVYGHEMNFTKESFDHMAEVLRADFDLHHIVRLSLTEKVLKEDVETYQNATGLRLQGSDFSNGSYTITAVRNDSLFHLPVVFEPSSLFGSSVGQDILSVKANGKFVMEGAILDSLALGILPSLAIVPRKRDQSSIDEDLSHDPLHYSTKNGLIFCFAPVFPMGVPPEDVSLWTNASSGFLLIVYGFQGSLNDSANSSSTLKLSKIDEIHHVDVIDTGKGVSKQTLLASHRSVLAPPNLQPDIVWSTHSRFDIFDRVWEVRCYRKSVPFRFGVLSWAVSSAVLVFVVVTSLLVYVLRRNVSHTEVQVEERTHLLSHAVVKNRTFLSFVAHEVRNPLSAIIATIQLLKDRDTAEQAEHFNVLDRMTDSINRIVEDTIALNRLETGTFELIQDWYNMKIAFQDVCKGFKEMSSSKQIELALEYGDGFSGDKEHIVFCDSVRICQVLSNLVGNALKYTHEFGSVAVRVDLKFIDGIHDEEPKPLPSSLLIEVQDTGIGIDKGELESGELFEAFCQSTSRKHREHGSAGLGLAIVVNLVKSMKGDLTVASFTGAGSLFKVKIPVLAKKAKEGYQESRLRKNTKLPQLTGARVAIIDDNAVVCKHLERLLRHHSAIPTVFESGNAFLSFMYGDDSCQHCDHDENPELFDVILCDYMMPGLTGPDTARVLRQSFHCKYCRNVPIVGISGNTLDCQLDDMLESGFCEIVAKPINMSELFATILRLAEMNKPSEA